MLSFHARRVTGDNRSAKCFMCSFASNFCPARNAEVQCFCNVSCNLERTGYHSELAVKDSQGQHYHQCDRQNGILEWLEYRRCIRGPSLQHCQSSSLHASLLLYISTVCGYSHRANSVPVALLNGHYASSAWRIFAISALLPIFLVCLPAWADNLAPVCLIQTDVD